MLSDQKVILGLFFCQLVRPYFRRAVVYLSVSKLFFQTEINEFHISGGKETRYNLAETHLVVSNFQLNLNSNVVL